MNRNILQLDFTIFEPALETFDVNELLGLNDNEENKDLVRRESICFYMWINSKFYLLI